MTPAVLRTTGGRRRRALVSRLSLAALVLAGCALTPPARWPDVAKPAPEAASRAAYFTLNGRISVRVDDKVETGQIRWARSVAEERVGLFTPFGGQVAELVKSGGGVRLTKQGETFNADSVSALTVALLGVPLELDTIADWIQAVDLREDVAREVSLDNGERWQVTVERLQARGAHRFAGRLVAIRGGTVVKLAVDDWTVP